MTEAITLWIVLGIGFAAGNAVYWAAWAAEREIRERDRDRAPLYDDETVLAWAELSWEGLT